MTKQFVETCAKEDIVKAISAITSWRLKAKAASVCDELFPETKGQTPARRSNFLRAVDRGLQAARKAGLVAFDSKTGWSVTAVSK